MELRDNGNLQGDIWHPQTVYNYVPFWGCVVFTLGCRVKASILGQQSLERNAVNYVVRVGCVMRRTRAGTLY